MSDDYYKVCRLEIDLEAKRNQVQGLKLDLAEQKQENDHLTKALARHAKLVLAAEKTLQDLRWMINNERYLTFDTLIGTEERLDAALAGCACATKGEPDGKKDP